MDSRKRIREAIEAFDWEGYILEHYDQYQTTMGSNGKELRINCPAPDCGDRKFKCYINPSKQQFNCFRCDFQVGKKYNLFNLIAFTEDITPAVAMLKVMRAYTPTAATDEEAENEVAGMQGDLGEAQDDEPAGELTTGEGTATVDRPDGPPFYRQLKELTLAGYYTSEVGATQELQWLAAPGRYDADAPLSEVGRAWA